MMPVSRGGDKERAEHDIPAEVVQEAIDKATIEPAG
jgi:hypothetical protein